MECKVLSVKCKAVLIYSPSAKTRQLYTDSSSETKNLVS
jgi:hypothetical protein